MGPYLKKSFYLTFDLGLTGYYSLIEVTKDNQFKVLESNKIITELREDKIYKVDTKTKSKSIVKNQVSYLKNLSEIKKLLDKYKINPEDILSFVEQLTPRPFNSRVSILSLGDTGATVRSIIESLHIDYLIIPPGTWKKGLNVTSDKETSINLFKECVANHKIITNINDYSNKKGEFNHNQIESILIAYWFFTK